MLAYLRENQVLEAAVELKLAMTNLMSAGLVKQMKSPTDIAVN